MKPSEIVGTWFWGLPGELKNASHTCLQFTFPTISRRRCVCVRACGRVREWVFMTQLTSQENYNIPEKAWGDSGEYEEYKQVETLLVHLPRGSGGTARREVGGSWNSGTCSTPGCPGYRHDLTSCEGPHRRLDDQLLTSDLPGSVHCLLTPWTQRCAMRETYMRPVFLSERCQRSR